MEAPPRKGSRLELGSSKYAKTSTAALNSAGLQSNVNTFSAAESASVYLILMKMNDAVASSTMEDFSVTPNRSYERDGAKHRDDAP
ncbi:hypothetical protein D3C84_1081090 [compost metagenome]